MFRWGIIFLVIALIAAALGFGGLAGTAAWAAKVVFVVGIVIFLISLFTGRKKLQSIAQAHCKGWQQALHGGK